MEFVLSAFVDSLRNEMYRSFPYEHKEINDVKHPNRIGHIRDVAFMNNAPTMLDENTYAFEIGNTYAEEKYPYYHILENAPYIRKRGRATTKSRGSQAKVENVGKRNYEKINWNGKTYSKEYAKNVRGSRDRTSKVSYWATDYMGREYFLNREANSYKNEHYLYIENMLNMFILDNLAREFGLKRMRTQLSGLEEDYMSQVSDEHNSLVSMITNAISSFEGEEDYD